MLGTKRRDIQHDGTSRRKSARISKAPPRLGFESAPTSPPSAAVQSLSSVASLSNVNLDIQLTSKVIAEYNSVLRFLQPSQLADPVVQRSNADLLQARAEAARTIQEVESRLWQLQDDLHVAQHRMMADAAARSAHWYQQADLLSLEYPVLSAVFQRSPIQDAADFTEYLCRVIPFILKQPIDVATLRARKRQARRCELRAEALGKVFMFRRALLTSSDPQALRHQVYFSVSMITSIIPRACWGEVWSPEEEDEFGNVTHRDQHLQWYQSAPALYNYCGEVFRYLDGVLTPPESDQDAWWTVPREFMDAAAMYRRCLSEYNSHDCPGRYDVYANGGRDVTIDEEHKAYYLSNGANVRCFHQHILRLIRALHRHARREIRQRTLIAAGTRLPVELTDVIFEYALQAESIPSFDDILINPTSIHGPTADLRPDYHVCDWSSSLPWNCHQRSYNTIICDYDGWREPSTHGHLEPPSWDSDIDLGLD